MSAPGSEMTPETAAGPTLTPATEPASGTSWFAAGLCAAAGVVHLVMVPIHAGSGLTDPLLFALAAWLQAGLAVALVARPATRVTWLATAGINAAMLGVWAWSRTRGLPWGAHAGGTEPVETVDAFTAIVEGLAVLVALGGAALGERIRAPRVAGVAGAAAVLALTTGVAVSPTTAEHSHAEGGDHSHATTTDHTDHTADMAAIDEKRCDLAFNPVAYWSEAATLGVDTYAGGLMPAHDHTTAGDSLLATVVRPEPQEGRGSPTLDSLISLTDKAGSSEGAAAGLVNRLSQASDADYEAWLGWLRDRHSTGDSHASGAGDDTGGHGGHVGPQPWKAIIDADQCGRLTDELAQARRVAMTYPTVADAEAAGWTKVTDYVPGIAAHYMRFDIVDGKFAVQEPEMLLYDGTLSTSRIVGLSYYLLHDGSSEPTQGFTGGNDHFHRHIGLCYRDNVVIGDSTTSEQDCAARGGSKGGGRAGWMSHAWVVPGCESPWGVFSAASPLLDRALEDASGTNDGGCTASRSRRRYDLTPGRSRS